MSIRARETIRKFAVLVVALLLTALAIVWFWSSNTRVPNHDPLQENAVWLQPLVERLVTAERIASSCYADHTAINLENFIDRSSDAVHRDALTVVPTFSSIGSAENNGVLLHVGEYARHTDETGSAAYHNDSFGCLASARRRFQPQIGVLMVPVESESTSSPECVQALRALRYAMFLSGDYHCLLVFDLERRELLAKIHTNAGNTPPDPNTLSALLRRGFPSLRFSPQQVFVQRRP